MLNNDQRGLNMALVKIRSWKPKSKQAPLQANSGPKKSLSRSASKPLGMNSKMDAAYAAVFKELAVARKQALQAVETAPPAGSPATPADKPQKASDQGPPPSPRSRRKAERAPIDLDRPGYLRLVDVLAVFPVSRAKWYAGVESGIYPQSHPLGLRARGWKTADIKQLVDAVLTKAVVST